LHVGHHRFQRWFLRKKGNEMTIKELKDDLNKLSPEYDNFHVEFSDKWAPLSSKDTDYVFRIDSPVVGLMVDYPSKEYLLLGNDAMTYYMKNIHKVIPTKGDKWKDSKKSRSKKSK